MKRILFAMVAILMAVNVNAQNVKYSVKTGAAFYANDYDEAPGVDLEMEASIPLSKTFRFMPALDADIPIYNVPPLLSLPLNIGVVLPMSRKSAFIVKAGPCPLLSFHEGPGIGGSFGIDYSARKHVIGFFFRVGNTDGEAFGGAGLSVGYRF